MADIGGITGDTLRAYIERIEQLEEEKAGIAADIREVYAEAKGTGLDPKIMRHVCKLRKMDSADREEQEYLVEIYKRALGMSHTLDDDGPGEPRSPAPKPAAKPAKAKPAKKPTPMPAIPPELRRGPKDLAPAGAVTRAAPPDTDPAPADPDAQPAAAGAAP